MRHCSSSRRGSIVCALLRELLAAPRAPFQPLRGTNDLRLTVADPGATRTSLSIIAASGCCSARRPNRWVGPSVKGEAIAGRTLDAPDNPPQCMQPSSRFRRNHGVCQEPTLFIGHGNCLGRLMVGKAWVLIKNTVAGFIKHQDLSRGAAIADHRHSDRGSCLWSRPHPRRDCRPAPRAYREAAPKSCSR
jgi:hypothetical protein